MCEERSDIDIIKGAITENFVCFSLVVNGYTPYYWESKGRAEVDFIIQNKQGYVIPIEVKSSDKLRSKSLMRYFELYNPPYAIRVSTKNFGSDSSIRSIPLYALFAWICKGIGMTSSISPFPFRDMYFKS